MKTRLLGQCAINDKVYCCLYKLFLGLWLLISLSPMKALVSRDERLVWIKDTFLKYLEDWRSSVVKRADHPYTAT